MAHSESSQSNRDDVDIHGCMKPKRSSFEPLRKVKDFFGLLAGFAILVVACAVMALCGFRWSDLEKL
jgi:hypothetical protein